MCSGCDQTRKHPRDRAFTECSLVAGTASGWPYLLLLNAVPAFVSLVFLPFIPESPRFLMIIKNKRIAAEKGMSSVCVYVSAQED